MRLSEIKERLETLESSLQVDASEDGEVDSTDARTTKKTTTWGNDNIPVAGETFREFVKSLYQRNELVGGQFRLNGEPVMLDATTCPLLMLVAEHDDLVPPAATLSLKQHVTSTDVEAMSVKAGHIGLAVGSKSHRQLWPSVAMWIADRSTVRV